MTESLKAISEEVVVCRRCPRLVEWREAVAAEPPARYRGEEYWARPLPGFGDPEARLLVVGLAPAAHGGNRTGRIFTGDRSGDWLFRALHRAGFANQATSVRKGDGLRLTGCYISAVVRCAPPANKPAPGERDDCLPFLVREIEALRRLRVIVALGAFAWDGALRALREVGAGATPPAPSVRREPRPKFGHCATAAMNGYKLIGSYHPSQQNTFTGKLTEQELDEVLLLARSELGR